jgi:hypothetical protein
MSFGVDIYDRAVEEGRVMMERRIMSVWTSPMEMRFINCPRMTTNKTQ